MNIERIQALVPTFRLAKLKRALEVYERSAKRLKLPFSYHVGSSDEVMILHTYAIDPNLGVAVPTGDERVSAAKVVVEGVLLPKING